MSKLITLSGLGELDDQTFEGLKQLANEHQVELYPTYYDHEFKGTADMIEKVTVDMWGMPRDEWEENGLHAEEVEE